MDLYLSPIHLDLTWSSDLIQLPALIIAIILLSLPSSILTVFMSVLINKALRKWADVWASSTSKSTKKFYILCTTRFQSDLRAKEKTYACLINVSIWLLRMDRHTLWSHTIKYNTIMNFIYQSLVKWVFMITTMIKRRCLLLFITTYSMIIFIKSIDWELKKGKLMLSL